jgi:hypothetical protein
MVKSNASADMELFDRIRNRIPRARKLNSTDIHALKEEYPGLPADYLQFLAEVGYGNLEEFQLHSGPSPADNFYPSNYKHLEGILIFGDDKQGYCFGLDVRDGFRVVEVSPRGEVSEEDDPGFSSLMRRYFGSDSAS